MRAKTHAFSPGGITLCYYLVRDVVPGTPCSYPAGRKLLLFETCQNEREAQKRADRYNECCNLPGQIHYSVVAWDESRNIFEEADSPLYVEAPR